MKSVYIVIVNWNGGKDTVECLDSIFCLSYPSYRVVVCDNGSTDDSLEVIGKWVKYRGLEIKELTVVESEQENSGEGHFPFVIIRNKINLGFAGGNNAGIRYALGKGDCSYVWLLNNDTIVDPNALTHMVERIERHHSIGMCGSTIRYYNDKEKIQAYGGGYYCRWLGLPWHYGRLNWLGRRIEPNKAEKWMNYVEGASILATRKFIENVGLMSEDYFLYFEEADWAFRAKGRFDLAYAPESIVYHKVGGSIGTSSNPLKKSYICDYFNIRNRIVFSKKFYPETLPTIYLVLLGEMLVRLILCRWDRIGMILKLLFGQRDEQLEMDCNLQTQL